MGSRITKKDFEQVAKHLENVLGIDLEINIWLNHYSVHVRVGNSACGDRLVCSDTARGAVEQMWAILDTLSVINKHKAKGEEK